MQCLKCGRAIDAGQVFCDNCLDGMAAQPIKPGTTVFLPDRPLRRRSAPVKQIPPEEIIHRLQKQVRRLWYWVAALMVLLALTLGALGYLLTHQDTGPSIGQNYNTITETTPNESKP